MKIFKGILDIISKAAQILLICLIGGIVLLMLNEIFIRNFLNKSFRGMTEMAGFLFMWMAFLGVAVLYDKERLIALDTFSAMIKGRGKLIIWYVNRIVALCLGLIMVIAFFGLFPFVSTEYFSSMPKFSRVWHYLPLAVCGGFMVLKSVYNLIEKSCSLLKEPEDAA
ncbi:MAG: TRAP transporter small permease [Treponema sp.]|jgi:TRAP-type C4-dicarboxylate transport system permease small subunit|nr:TRAP transporter small permease [Treponema sp.]